MENVFLEEFLMISHVNTVVLMALLFFLFYIIRFLYKKKEMSFSKVVLIGTIMGLLVGLLIQFMAGFPEKPLEVVFVNETINWYNLFANGYMRAVQMIVAPLVMISILHVIINISQGESAKKLVSKTVVVTLFMTFISAIVGLLVANLFNLGAGFEVVSEAESTVREIIPIAKTFSELIPSNIIGAMSSNSIIGIVIFSGVFGLAIWWVNYEDEELAKPLYNMINGLHKAMVNMALLILDYMPYAVIVLLARTIAGQGVASILEVGKFILVLYFALFIQFLVQLFVLYLNGFNPIVFIKKSAPILLMAFTTRSSVTCLPMTIKTLTNELGTPESTASFVASFGTTAGMQGCAGIFPAVLIIYICNITGTPIDITTMIMSAIVITVGSLGIAGIPGTATIAATVSMSGVGMITHFPLISPILAIDPLIDMGRTLINVSGSVSNALIVSKRLKNHNMQEYKSSRTD